MEAFGLQALHRRVAGIDMHRMLHVVTARAEYPDGLAHASSIPPKDLRQSRLISRYRRILVAMCVSEFDRLHRTGQTAYPHVLQETAALAANDDS
jgi:hypothetical protein